MDVVLTRGCTVGVESLFLFSLNQECRYREGLFFLFLGGGVQLWDCLKTVCVCVHGVVLGGGGCFGKGLRVSVHACTQLLPACYTS